MMERAPTVGVLVGRFQVDELHEGHVSLIESVVKNHPKVIIFLGLSPCKSTLKNPLDLESRKQMILKQFPEITVLYIKDVNNDVLWSKNLDKQIEDNIGPRQTAVLYGGRDSFVNLYRGKYETKVLHLGVFKSGNEVRKTISAKVKASDEFRAGVIWATANQYPHCYPTVDIAILNEDGSKVLLARKEDEALYRFVGGFVNPGETFEAAAQRETAEETHLETAHISYIGSYFIDDWRYKGEDDKITTAFFARKLVFGIPSPDDDICELKWFDVDDKNLIEKIVLNHRQLMGALRIWLQDEASSVAFRRLD